MTTQLPLSLSIGTAVRRPQAGWNPMSMNWEYDEATEQAEWIFIPIKQEPPTTNVLQAICIYLGVLAAIGLFGWWMFR